MTVYRCKRCKTVLDVAPDNKTAVCSMCGKKQRLPRIDPEIAARIRKKAAIISTVSVLACAAVLILLFTLIIPTVKYNDASKLYESKKYDEAIAVYKSIKGFKDSSSQIIKCESAKRESNYNTAVSLYGDGKYEEALTLFSSLRGYKDSGAYAALCEEAVKEIRYNKAVLKIENGVDDKDVVSVYETLMGLDGYKNSAEEAKKIFDRYKTEKLKSAGAGDTVYFGSYEQDNNENNGKEDIAWLVLDSYGDELLLISKYALDSHPYDAECKDVTWETCSLRKWLNGAFYDTAFDKEEREKVMTSHVAADKNPIYGISPGNDTEDKVYLLSIAEVNAYFSSSEDRMCIPTDYAIERGAGTGDSYFTFGKTLCWWVLRTPGCYPYYVSFVYYSGYVNAFGYEVSVLSDAIRPVLRIKTK